MNVTLVKIHEPDAVREIIREALDLTEEMMAPPHLEELVFAKAVDLLSQRLPIMPQANTLPVDLSQLRRS